MQSQSSKCFPQELAQTMYWILQEFITRTFSDHVLDLASVSHKSLFAPCTGSCKCFSQELTLTMYWILQMFLTRTYSDHVLDLARVYHKNLLWQCTLQPFLTSYSCARSQFWIEMFYQVIFIVVISQLSLTALAYILWPSILDLFLGS